jgi:hypothetical protein
VNAGERDSVSKEGGKKKGSACEEKCASSADVGERGVASIGVRSSGNLCVEEEYV